MACGLTRYTEHNKLFFLKQKDEYLTFILWKTISNITSK